MNAEHMCAVRKTLEMVAAHDHSSYVHKTESVVYFCLMTLALDQCPAL